MTVKTDGAVLHATPSPTIKVLAHWLLVRSWLSDLSPLFSPTAGLLNKKNFAFYLTCLSSIGFCALSSQTWFFITYFGGFGLLGLEDFFWVSNFVKETQLCLDCLCNPEWIMDQRPTWRDFGRQYRRLQASVLWVTGPGPWFCFSLACPCMSVSNCLNVRNWLLGTELRCPKKPWKCLFFQELDCQMGRKHNFVYMPECPISLLRDLLNTRVTFAPGQMSIKIPLEQACKFQAVPQREQPAAIPGEIAKRSPEAWVDERSARAES